MKVNGKFEKMMEYHPFKTRLLCIIFDEAHCISRWGTFRQQYRDVGRLRYFLPKTPFYATSATLPQKVLNDVRDILHMRTNDTELHVRSNDRPNVYLAVRKMEYSAKSFKDLGFLIPRNWNEDLPKPPKFLIFFDNMNECQNICKYLRSLLPKELRNKIKWFHSVMTNAFRAAEVDALIGGGTWGLCVTDSFGMVCN